MTAFFVAGDPKPQGSKRHVGGGRLVEQVKGLERWRELVRRRARENHSGAPYGGPLRLTCEFRLQRPKSHHTGSDRERAVKPAFQRVMHLASPDLDKLVRAINDALTGVVSLDDAQIVEIRAEKRYVGAGEHPGVWIVVEQRA